MDYLDYYKILGIDKTVTPGTKWIDWNYNY